MVSIDNIVFRIDHCRDRNVVSVRLEVRLDVLRIIIMRVDGGVGVIIIEGKQRKTWTVSEMDRHPICGDAGGVSVKKIRQLFSWESG